MRSVVFMLAALAATACSAQWEVPVRIELNGPTPEDRQVTGLADPISPDAGVSVDAARSSVVTYATVSGGALLVGSLSPAPLGYAAGMLVTIVPSQVNEAGAQLDLNGLGPQDIVKAGGVPLEPADLTPGVPARLIHDGVRFRVISSTYLPCPTGFHVGGREYCIEDSSRSDTAFHPAIRICRDMGARLCTFAEWTHACRKDPSFMTTVLNAEWVDSAANNVADVKVVGYGGNGIEGDPVMFGCQQGYWAVPSASRGFRCCWER